MEDIRCRRDGIRTKEEVLTRFLCRGDKAPCRRFISGDGGIRTVCFRRLTFQTDLIDRQGQVLTVVITIDHNLGIRRNEGGFLLEFLFEQMDCFLHRLIKEPIDKAQSEHIPAFEDGFIIHSALAERLFGKRRECDRHNLNGLRDA